jgi:DNA-binding IscR family transcriptional regulator
VAEKEEVVLAAMKKAGTPMKSGEIADTTGIDKKEVAKIIDGLKKEGKVASPKRCYWEPSK